MGSPSVLIEGVSFITHILKKGIDKENLRQHHFDNNKNNNNQSQAVMERFQGPMNPCFLGEHLDLEWLQQGIFNKESSRFEDAEEIFLTPNLEDKMPFLEMLQSVETPPLLPFKEPNFQTLLRLQHIKKPWEIYQPFMPEMETQIQPLELESCVTHDLHSPVKSETKDLQIPHSTSCLEGVSSDSNQEQPNSVDTNCCIEGNSHQRQHTQTTRPKHTHFLKSPPMTREKRKRKRTKPIKNKEEVESQRMTHIAVERNRRRQMNDHLNSLRSLMPPSYVQRGDQASIIGGAIDFVKELEQLLQSLEAKKKMKRNSQEDGESSTFDSVMGVNSLDNLFESCQQCRTRNLDEEMKAENKSEAAEIQVTVIQNHVNLKIQCQKKHGQLLKAIVALEDLRVTVLHLNITSSQSTVLYSFNLKIEENCKMVSADEIAAAVNQIFNLINGS
ncbi:HLH domain-containing protein [Cephalotus follicularis]|uniref:HLH domain-containing protein n=1 Tax=Cephalotus follicularis TaxID=3775 RepID=A0A1Q3C7Z8_CEPFO|nr:HLH domain-containing protein [Cephalotus follicularis]